MADFSHSGARDRGICSVCDREFDITVKGKIRAHGICKGAGQPPRQDSVTVITAEHPSHGTCTHCDDRKRLTKDGIVFNHYDGRIPSRPQQGWCRGSDEKPKEANES
jgi:hypothetical protein